MLGADAAANGWAASIEFRQVVINNISTHLPHHHIYIYIYILWLFFPNWRCRDMILATTINLFAGKCTAQNTTSTRCSVVSTVFIFTFPTYCESLSEWDVCMHVHVHTETWRGAKFGSLCGCEEISERCPHRTPVTLPWRSMRVCYCALTCKRLCVICMCQNACLNNALRDRLSWCVHSHFGKDIEANASMVSKET